MIKMDISDQQGKDRFGINNNTMKEESSFIESYIVPGTTHKVNKIPSIGNGFFSI